ncbi:T9SS type A sorting domain-containing protein [Pseudotamlana agarivorans]|uniref:T9SS type A sorting domain-containing protein n=1 Tax=Pseudotamlana agarivorans TaxID=481183 RepID=UPI0008377578|nr:T9SS type A sorting domain-containing protein [Tamlana agarivorans]
MTKFKYLLALVLCFFYAVNHAQTGPGGVGTNDGSSNLIMWFRPDNGVSTTASAVDSWENSAGISDFNMSESTTQRPTLITNAVNGYDEISFNGSNKLVTGMTLTTSNFIVNEASSFVVVRADNTTQRSCVYTTDPLVGSTRFTCHIPWENQVYFDIGTCCGTDARIQVSGLSGLTNYSIWSYGAHPTTGKQLYRNENLLQNRGNTTTYNSYSTQRFNLGGNTSGTAGFVGDMTEVAIFKTKVNAAQRIIINNYLSAKYDQALTANNFYLQDNAANGNFDHNVAGIGQASDSSSHTDSQGTGIVRINTPSNLSNGDYLFWGENIKDATYEFATNTTNYTEQLNTTWRVSKANNLGTVTVTFDISAIDLSGFQGTTCSPLQLILDNDSDVSSPTSVYPLTISGTTATVSGVSFSNGDYFTLRYTDQIVWDGSLFFNGSGTANAPSAADACLKLTVKAGSPATLSATAHVREVEVESGATLNVNDGLLLEVEDSVTIDGTLDLLGEAQLIQNHSGPTTNSGNGSLIIRQQGTTNLYNYNYWSAPVNRGGRWEIGWLEDASGPITFNPNVDADPSTSPITLSSRWLYTFSGVTNNYYAWQPIDPTTVISSGVGYTLKGSGASSTEQEYVFKGIPNDGDYTKLGLAGNDLLLGNPYPSAMDATQFINDNAGIITGTLYFWEHFSSNNSHYLKDYEGGYATYNLIMGISAAIPDNSGLTSGMGTASKVAPTGNISVGQGFFVTNSSTAFIQFNNGQRVFAKDSDGGSIFYKSNSNKSTTTQDNRTKIWFAFLEPNNIKKIFGLGYDPNHATIGYDNGYDAIAFDEFKNDIYWPLEDKELVIQALPHINIEDELPVTIKATDGGIYKMTIDDSQHLPDALEVFLKDFETNSYFDLRNTIAEINLQSGTYENRFAVVFQKGSLLNTEGVAKNTVTATYNKPTETLALNHIEDLSNIASVIIYDVNGKKVITKRTLKSASIDVSALSEGLYILNLKLKSDSNKRSIKFLKY